MKGTRPRPPQRILLIQLRRFGDVVLCTPLAADLRRAFPQARLDWMVEQPAAQLLQHNPNIDEVVLLPRKGLVKTILEVRRRRYDWIIDVQANPRTAIITLLSGAKERAGWAARFWGRCYNRRTVREAEPMYTARNRQRLLELLGVEPGPSLPQLYLTDEEAAEGVQAASGLGVTDRSQCIGLALATHDVERDYRISSFAQLAEQLEAAGLRVLVFRFPGDDLAAQEFREATRAGTFVPWQGDRKFFGLLKQCAVLVSPDTGPAHMATALAVPRVTLYGPTNPTTWCPDIDIAVPLTNPRQPCLGCRRKPCPIDRECIRGILPSEVRDAVLRLRARSNPEPAA